MIVLPYETELHKTIRVGDSLPDGYARHTTIESYLRRECAARCRFSLVGQDGCYGARWHYGPFFFEKYVSDEEPFVSSDGMLRRVIWQPISREPDVDGWDVSPSFTMPRLSGLAELGDTSYASKWTGHARRHLREWQRESGWGIAPVGLDEFLQAYKLSPQAWLLRQMFKMTLKDKMKAHGDRVHLFGARRTSSDAPIAAGLAVLDIPEASQSVHLISFLSADAKEVSAGVGLIDVWFCHCLDHHLRFLDFDVFWAPGDPPSWRGFSRFKSQFCTRFILHPHARIRWAGWTSGLL